MGKHGPCYHCGATSTPLWRNGPPEKPVLCNACGSRWRTKGSLTNYTPLHARTEHDDLEDCRMARLRAISIKNKEARALKRKQTIDNADLGAFAFDINPSSKNFFDEDTSNRSSSGSAISYSESCAQFGGDASDFTDPAQTTVWDSTVPSRKRTCVTRPKQSSVEKLTKDLYTILHEQPFSWLSGSSEDDLLYETDRPMVSVEIGHGSVLIRHPNSIPREEESEASSLSVDNKLHPVNEAYSPLTAFPVHSNSKRVNLPRQETEKFKKPTGQFTVDQDQMKSDQLEKLHMLSHHDSPLQSVYLKDVVNFDEFSSRLTREEQLQLHKYLPSIDTSNPPESLKRMFQSQYLEESLHTFQKLLGEGVFDNTLSEMTTEDSRMLKSSVLCDLTKSRWVEHYSLLKDVNSNGTCTSEGAGEYNVITTGHPMNAKKIIRDGQGEKNTIPKRSMIKVNYENLKVMENNNSGFCQKTLFSPPDNNSSIDFDSFAAGCYDQDLLLDVPSNNSFPQAELLLPSSSFVS